MFPIIIIEIEDHEEQGYMKQIFISIVLLFSLTIFAEPVGFASVNHDVIPKWSYKTIAMEATKQESVLQETYISKQGTNHLQDSLLLQWLH